MPTWAAPRLAPPDNTSAVVISAPVPMQVAQGVLDQAPGNLLAGHPQPDHYDVDLFSHGSSLARLGCRVVNCDAISLG